MRNRFIVFFLLSAVFLTTNAQIIENKLHFQSSYGIANALGSKNTNEDGFVLPSLYTNYPKGSQLSLRTTYKLRVAWSLGAEFNRTNFDNWEYGEGENLFKNSSSTLTSVGICVKIHTQFRQEGLYNRLQLYAFFSPCINRINLTLQEPTFSVQAQSTRPPAEIERNSQSWGMNAGAGLIYSVTQNLGFFTEGGLFVSRVESQLHNDKLLKAAHFNFGLCIHIMKFKRLY